LTESELKVVWNTFQPPVDIQGLGTSPTVCYIIQLCIVTLQRRGEVAGMTLDELDLENKLWTIPSTRTKNKRTHVVPLSDLALQIIEKALAIRKQESVYVFPTAKAGVDGAIDPHSATRAFARFRKAVGLENMHIHDLRRTGATMMTGEKIGISRFIVSKILNHAGDTGGAAITTGVYDRNEYLKEKRGALTEWTFYLLKIV
jgi:integrase